MAQNNLPTLSIPFLVPLAFLKLYLIIFMFTISSDLSVWFNIMFMKTLVYYITDIFCFRKWTLYWCLLHVFFTNDFYAHLTTHVNQVLIIRVGNRIFVKGRGLPLETNGLPKELREFFFQNFEGDKRQQKCLKSEHWDASSLKAPLFCRICSSSQWISFFYLRKKYESFGIALI